jgi:hypothetical protein
MSSYTVDSISASSTAARPAPNGAAAATWHAVFEFEEPRRRAQHAAAAAAVLAGAVLKTIPIEERGAEEEALEWAAWEVFDRICHRSRQQVSVCLGRCRP